MPCRSDNTAPGRSVVAGPWDCFCGLDLQHDDSGALALLDFVEASQRTTASDAKNDKPVAQQDAGPNDEERG